VRQDFPDALEALRKGGDEAYRAGRYEEAGRRWAAVLRLADHPAAKGQAAAQTKADVHTKLDRMTAMLMERAIVEYRNGNMEGAIALWKGVLAYDPTNREAARSLRTAVTQLENLKKISPPAR